MKRKRAEIDIMQLLMEGHNIKIDETNSSHFVATIKGPPESPYENGEFEVKVEIPSDFPFKSPSIGFLTKIFHPNIDFQSGSVCLDVINQTWSPMFSIKNIIDTFLPQLLSYPEPTDPLNVEAGSLMLKDYELYIETAVKNTNKYALSKASSESDVDESDYADSDRSDF